MKRVKYELSYGEHSLICRGLETLIKDDRRKLGMNIHPVLKERISLEINNISDLYCKLICAVLEEVGDPDVKL